jgi:hypothetical protein
VQEAGTTRPHGSPAPSSHCAAVSNGCQFDRHPWWRNVRDVFVPWVPRSIEINQVSIRAVSIEAVDRGDGMFVLRSMKEIMKRVLLCTSPPGWV